MSDIKAIFFDIDGTLVPFGAGGIPGEVSDAIAAVRRKGVKVFISTGRHLRWVDNLGDTQFDGYVTVNGGMLFLSDRSTEIYHHPIDKEDIRRFVEFSHRTSMPLVVVPADGDITISRVDETVRFVTKQLCITDIYESDTDYALDRDIVQLMAFGPEEERRESGLFGDVLRHCKPTSWNPYFCDIIPDDSDKSLGIIRMAEYFGIHVEQTMAFGDGGNDVGMIRAAGIGVAMGNATEEARNAADHITTDVSDHGVINAFRHFGLL